MNKQKHNKQYLAIVCDFAQDIYRLCFVNRLQPNSSGYTEPVETLAAQGPEIFDPDYQIVFFSVGLEVEVLDLREYEKRALKRGDYSDDLVAALRINLVRSAKELGIECDVLASGPLRLIKGYTTPASYIVDEFIYWEESKIPRIYASKSVEYADSIGRELARSV